MYTSIHVSGSTAKYAVRVSEIDKQTTIVIHKQNMTATSPPPYHPNAWVILSQSSVVPLRMKVDKQKFYIVLMQAGSCFYQ